MPSSESAEVTQLLQAWRAGDPQALEQFMPLVYRELHRLARRYMAGERPGHTLQASALVNEAYLKLIQNDRVQWQSRAHFIGVAAQLMRRILVDFARRRHYQKRGGEALRVTFNEDLAVSAKASADFAEIDEALNALAALDSRKARVIELRFFGGLSVEETAEVLQVSADTVLRDWRLARAWLHREMRQEADGA